MLSTKHRGREHARSGRQVKQGSGVKTDHARVETEAPGCDHGIGPEVLVAEHHALGAAGGATGVENACQLLAAPARVLSWTRGGKCGFVIDRLQRRFATPDV